MATDRSRYIVLVPLVIFDSNGRALSAWDAYCPHSLIWRSVVSADDALDGCVSQCEKECRK